jgi:hypothetical protein
MVKLLRYCLAIILVFLFNTCERHETYDLFPLKEGNEFYYTYYKKNNMPTAITEGIETWKVISESAQGDSITYLVEHHQICTVRIGYDTIIHDWKWQDIISEKKQSSVISKWGFLFKRYQSVSRIELYKQGYSTSPSISCVFKADSGLVSYYYHHPPNHVYDESLALDSLKIVH